MYERFIKRLLDIMIGLVGAVVFIPIFLIVAPLIWLEDKGTVFYNAPRIGRHGKLYKMYKFRSMKMNAPDIRLADGSTYNGEDDPRVTRIGRILRKTSIDELPQVFNILRGEMSLIGPRPDPPDHMELYPKEVLGFLNARPGITGYNQAYFRNSSDGHEKMRNDAYYAEHCSFLFDVRIFFKTFAVILKQENVYRDTANEADALEKVQQIR